MHAARRGFVDIVKELIEDEAKIRDKTGRTALM